MTVELLGYSERGMVNALCTDISFSIEPLNRLKEFLGWCKFPHLDNQPIFDELIEAKLIIEQSFSKFGDPDLIVLLTYTNDRKQAILVEAKVSTATGSPRQITHHWDDFISYMSDKESENPSNRSSSLFVQMYRKVRLVRKLQNPDNFNYGDDGKRRWSLGNNGVVHNAALKLSEYLKLEPLFIAIVPYEVTVMNSFFENTLKGFKCDRSSIPDWSTEHWGFVSWIDIYNNTKTKTDDDITLWPQLEKNFKWNKNQIFPIELLTPREASIIPQVGFYTYKKDPIYLAVSRSQNCRIISASMNGDKFSESSTLPREEWDLLARKDTDNPDPNSLKPLVNEIYRWNPMAGQDIYLKGSEEIPVPPCNVKIKYSGWKTSLVIRIEDGKTSENWDPFHILNHDLDRNPPSP